MNLSEARKTATMPQPPARQQRLVQPPAAYDPNGAAQISQIPTITPGFMNLQSFELIQRAAKLLASSTLVPKEYQGNLSNCVIALNMASRMGADPLMVMQNLYLVHGRPSWSAQFLIATFNQCGRFTAIKYEWRGKKGQNDWGCRAYATEKATGERIESTWIDWALVNAEGWNQRNGNKWRTMPEQMFLYRSAAWLVRAYAPELSMGLHTAEENMDRVFEAEYQQDVNAYIAEEEPTSTATPYQQPPEGYQVDTLTGELFPGGETASHQESEPPETSQQGMENYLKTISECLEKDDVDMVADSARTDTSLTRIMRNKITAAAEKRLSEIQQNAT